MNKFFTGNVLNGSPESRGWFAGPFMPDGLQQTDDVKVKFELIPKGRFRESTPSDEDVVTLAVLAYGALEIAFANETTFVLNKPGDYLIWRPNMDHCTQALADSAVTSVRWTPNDCRNSK